MWRHSNLVPPEILTCTEIHLTCIQKMRIHLFHAPFVFDFIPTFFGKNKMKINFIAVFVTHLNEPNENQKKKLTERMCWCCILKKRDDYSNFQRYYVDFTLALFSLSLPFSPLVLWLRPIGSQAYEVWIAFKHGSYKSTTIKGAFIYSYAQSR